MKAIVQITLFVAAIQLLLVQACLAEGSAPAQAGEAPPPVPDGTLEQLLDWMQGDFHNLRQYRAQGTDEGDFSHLGLQRRLVRVPALGEHVIYAQINRRADPDDVYRQFLQVFSVDDNGEIKSRILRFVDAEKHLDILAHPETFDTLSAEEFRPALAEGCEPRWRIEDNAYRVSIDRRDCIIVSQRDGKPRHIQSTEFVEAQRIRNEESGYLPDGAQIFGLPDGVYYEYLRVCATP